ncbi:unnamed protein product [Microthlaspi erraticum]|uniref:Uncharacterized protein n=1 Tax=Microthlaspi erraticum TaxID=1685480 RepID=A0A6D2HEK3_9BRAS|nr:unnamed protein product [Microthlaspi erraticum]
MNTSKKEKKSSYMSQKTSKKEKKTSSDDSGSEPPRSAVLALAALRYISEEERRLRYIGPRRFYGQNAPVQGREMVITNVLGNEAVQHNDVVVADVVDNNEPVIDAIPISFAYIPQGSRGFDSSDRSRGGRGEYHQGSSSSMVSEFNKLLVEENQPIQVQPSSGTNDMDVDEVKETDEHHK